MPELPIPSPYNFVPLSSRVFFPDWAAQVSHDVPFSDGVSGWLEIEVEATTPVFIRGGGRIPKPKDSDRVQWVNDDTYLPETKQFARLYPGGPFAIPGTSLKGMIRSLLETVAFGKFQPVDDRHYSVRDLNTRDRQLYQAHLAGRNPKGHIIALAQAGYLRRRADGRLEVFPCDHARVEQTDLEAYARSYLAKPRINLGGRQRAEDKYTAWGANLQLDFAPGPPPPHYTSNGDPLDFELADSLSPGTRAQVVFTGQPSPRGGPGKKHREFLFYNRRTAAITVSPEVEEQFRFIHSDGHGGMNEDFAFLAKRFWVRGVDIPVFYLESGGRITALGLAQMFRLPYRFTPRDLARHQQPLDDPRPDLAETLFGRAAGAGGLRGRIHFEPLPYVEGTARELPTVQTVLGAPKPTYYPNYLEQDLDESKQGLVTGTYATLMQDDPSTGGPAARLRGWKQYRARSDVSQPEQRPPPTRQDGTVNHATVTCFRPLDRGVRFRGRVHVHNLRPAELGALLWALTWGGDGSLRHRLGLAKPLGYGNVQIRVLPESSLGLATLRGERLHPEDLPPLRDRFVKLMDDWCGAQFRQSWQETPQFRAACALADPKTEWPNKAHHPADVKDFGNYKRYKVPKPGDGTQDLSYALLPVPGVGFPPTAPPGIGPAAPPPPTPPATPPAPAAPPPDLTGQTVIARIKGRLADRDPWFQFTVGGQIHKGRLMPEFRTPWKNRKTITMGEELTLLIAGPPDADGRYPLAKPED